MTNLCDGEIVQVMTGILAKRLDMQAFSHALKRQIENTLRMSERLAPYIKVESMPEWMLDIMAVDMDTQYYEEGLPVETKRKLIKETIDRYAKAGTPSAVEEIISSAFGMGELTEWYEYDDEPYYFKVKIDMANATTSVTPDMYDEFNRIIKKVKNARSHIRSIEVHDAVAKTLYAGAGIYRYKKQADIVTGND